MQPLNEFLIELAQDINMVNESKIAEKQPVSFVSFLGTLSNEKLEKYTEVVEKLLKKKSQPTTEDIKKGIMFYSLIITELENHPKDSTVTIDDEGLWAVSLFTFLTMEKFYREGLVANFSGLLKDGNPLFKPTQKMYDIKEDVVNSMTAEERKKYNL